MTASEGDKLDTMSASEGMSDLISAYKTHSTSIHKGDPKDPRIRQQLVAFHSARSLLMRQHPIVKSHSTSRLVVASTHWSINELDPKPRLIVMLVIFALSEHEGDSAFVDSHLITISARNLCRKLYCKPKYRHQHQNCMTASEGDSLDIMSASKGDSTVEERNQDKPTKSSYGNKHAQALLTES